MCVRANGVSGSTLSLSVFVQRYTHINMMRKYAQTLVFLHNACMQECVTHSLLLSHDDLLLYYFTPLFHMMIYLLYYFTPLSLLLSHDDLLVVLIS